MPFPVGANDWKDLIIDTASSVCSRWAKMIRASVIHYKFFSFILDVDGNLTDDFKSAISDVTVRVGDLIFSAAPLDETLRLRCDGRAVSRTTYAVLFSKIGTLYGAGDAATTFNIPNYQDRFPKGKASEDIFTTGGEATHVLTQAEMMHKHATGRFELDTGSNPDHLFVLLGTTDGPSGNSRRVVGATSGLIEEDLSAQAGTYTETSTPLKEDSSGDDPVPTAHNNLPPYFSAFIYIFTGPV